VEHAQCDLSGVLLRDIAKFGVAFLTQEYLWSTFLLQISVTPASQVLTVYHLSLVLAYTLPSHHRSKSLDHTAPTFATVVISWS
jgi:hypothetical protein